MTILPPNRTPFEVAMESAIKSGQNISDLVIRNLWNPDTCPLEVLPWLAWALSVDKWDQDWSEEIKRNVVRSSVEVHRKKGTVHAIKQAVRAVYSDTEINEWFNYGGNPYHFKIAVDIGNGLGFSYDLAGQIKDVALSAKNVRSKLEALTIIIRQMADTPKIGSAVISANTIEILPQIVDLIEVVGGPKILSCQNLTSQIITVYPTGGD